VTSTKLITAAWERKRNSSSKNVVIGLKMFETSTFLTEDIEVVYLVVEHSASGMRFVKISGVPRIENTDISNDQKC